MLNALYYPHTDIHSETIIKNALLLWDSVETIVPNPDWSMRQARHHHHARVAVTPVMDEAVELVVQRRVPSSDERRSAHEALEGMLQSGFVNSLIAKSRELQFMDRNYLIYPEKFLYKTWELLTHNGLANWESHERDFGVPAALGYLMMSTLADACAGSQLQKITDRVDAYSWLAQHKATTLGSPYVTGLDVSQVAPTLDRLVTLTCEVLDARSLPMERLVEFRKRELKSGSEHFKAMRRKYASSLQQYVKRIGSEARTGNDVRELEYQFKERAVQDLADLRSELKIANLKTLFSKEVGISVMVLAGCLIAPIVGVTSLASQLGGPLGIIPLIKSQINLHEARTAALRAHSISWLYLSTKGGMTLY